MNTDSQFQSIITQCRKLFVDKMKDYGPAWRILRLPSITDQIYIKANRIRSLQTKDSHLVEEGVEPEFIGIVNYSAMAIVQLREGVADQPDMDDAKAEKLFSGVLEEAFNLMKCKNHDYDEAWRNMRVSSITDIIIMKLLRVKQIEDNKGLTVVSEGLDANYFDMINYAIFALILLSEGREWR